MLKNYFLFFVLAFIGTSYINAQCTPHVTNNQGIHPSPILDTGCVNEAYFDTITLVAPVDTTVSIPIPPFTLTIPLDSMIILGFLNEPPGITLSCGGNCTVYPGGPTTPAKSCVVISGASSNLVLNQQIGVIIDLWATVPVVGVDNFTDTQFIYLTIDSIDNSVSVSAPTITANQIGATYRWLDCGSSYGVIPGETGVSYTATTSGNYAVEITKGNCIDTSGCENITTTDIEKLDFASKFKLFPNPSEDGNFNISIIGNHHNLTIEVFDLTGKLISHQIANNSNLIELNLGENKGSFFVKLSDQKGNQFTKLITTK